MAIREREEMLVHFEKQTQIEGKAHVGPQGQSKALVVALIFDQTLTTILVEYFNYRIIFSAENATKLLVHTRINDHAIKLEKSKQPLFGSIYSLRPVELEILKTYIKTNLANGFIWPSKSPARAFILFNRKLNRSLRHYMNYYSINIITIKNKYPLPMIYKLLDWLD